MAPDVLQDTLTFTAKLGSALTRYGAPAHRIEDVLHLLTKDLGVEGVFSATPSLLLMEFKGPNGNEVRIERVYSNDIDLTRLRRLDSLFNQVAAKTISPSWVLCVSGLVFFRPSRAAVNKVVTGTGRT